MFVVVNVNNLEIEFAILEDSGKVNTRFNISALDKKTSDQYISEIKNVFDYLKVDTTNIDYVAVLSVVPKFTHILEEFFNKYIKVKPLVIENKNINIGLLNSDVDKNSIPVDILATTYAGTKLYNDNVIVVNFGAITTFGIAVNNEFVGYVVYPSEDILSSILHEKITDFPEIAVRPTREVYSTTKYNAMNCGIFNGMIGACDNIINGIKGEFEKKNFKVIACCKNAELIQYSKTINIVDSDLVIKSIVECAKEQLFSI